MEYYMPSLVTCEHCIKRYEDDIFMCWRSNKFVPSLNFLSDLEAIVKCLWENNKKLDAVLEVKIGGLRLLPRQ
ncbi:hypothetical protein CsatB_003800 [Cannabis sativa]